MAGGRRINHLAYPELTLCYTGKMHNRVMEDDLLRRLMRHIVRARVLLSAVR